MSANRTWKLVMYAPPPCRAGHQGLRATRDALDHGGQWVAGFAWMALALSDHLSLGLSAAIAAGILVIGSTAKDVLRRGADSRRQALAE